MVDVLPCGGQAVRRWLRLQGACNQSPALSGIIELASGLHRRGCGLHAPEGTVAGIRLHLPDGAGVRLKALTPAPDYILPDVTVAGTSLHTPDITGAGPGYTPDVTRAGIRVHRA